MVARPTRRRSDATAGTGPVPEAPPAAVATVPTPTPTAPAVPTTTTTPAADRGKPVRTTLVLDADEYDALQSKVLEAQRITGRRGVAGAEIMRNLLALANEDTELWNRVLDRITEHGGNRRGRT